MEIERWNLPPPPDGNSETGFVDLMGNSDDYHVVLLASMGMNYKTISRQTGLSVGQISYRLAKLNKRLKPEEQINAFSYRNGQSRAAKAVIRYASGRVATAIHPTMRRALAVVDV